MRIVGLITEYNPFHKGHAYHIRKAKELTGADTCVVVMSGNYVQRGTPAFIDKHTRTSVALSHGADAVFELPVPFSCSSAEYFATAAVTYLHKMGIVTHICFGAENSDMDKLQNIAATLADAKLDNSHLLNKYIKDNLKAGMSYATARSAALEKYINISDDSTINNDALDNIASLLDMPNNILAIEYLKALRLLHSDIIPVAIARTEATYHDSVSNNPLYSASSVRAALTDSTDTEKKALVLEKLYEFSDEYRTVLGKTAPIEENDLSNITDERLLHLCLSDASCNTLTDYMGIDNDLQNRISNSDILFNHTCFTDLVQKLKTKNIAYTSISRALLAITLGITKSDVEAYIDNGFSSYIRLLGFRKESSALLNEIKKKGELTIIGQLSEINDKKDLAALDKKLLSHSIYCDELYNMIVRNKYKCHFLNEYQRKILIK